MQIDTITFRVLIPPMGCPTDIVYVLDEFCKSVGKMRLKLKVTPS